MTKCIHKDLSIFQKLLRAIGTAPVADAIVPNEAGEIRWHLVEPLTRDQDKHKTIAAFEKAFSVWQKHFTPIKFVPTANAHEAPIKIHFMQNGDPHLPARFDSGVLAYAYFPQRESLGIHSDMYFNDAYAWAEMHSRNHINLFKVAVHELGHAFGLDHSRIQTDIMYPTYQPNDNVVITDDTTAGIEKLYKEAKQRHTPVLPDQPEPSPEEPASPTDENDPVCETITEFVENFFEHRFQIINLTTRQLTMVENALSLAHDGSKIARSRRVWTFLGVR